MRDAGSLCQVQLPRQLDVSHSTTAATQRAPQVQRPMVAGRKGLQSTLPSPPPHMQLPSLRGRLESTLRGEAKALPLLGHGCQMWWARMAGNGANSSWPLLGDNDSYWFREENSMNPTPVAFPSTSLFYTWHSALSASHDRPGRFRYRHSQTYVLRFSAHATTMTHLLSLQDDRDNLASPEQTSDITSMMHTFTGIIAFLN